MPVASGQRSPLDRQPKGPRYGSPVCWHAKGALHAWCSFVTLWKVPLVLFFGIVALFYSVGFLSCLVVCFCDLPLYFWWLFIVMERSNFPTFYLLFIRCALLCWYILQAYVLIIGSDFVDIPVSSCWRCTYPCGWSALMLASNCQSSLPLRKTKMSISAYIFLTI